MAAELLFAPKSHGDLIEAHARYANSRVMMDASIVVMVRSYAADKLDRLSEISCGAQRI